MDKEAKIAQLQVEIAALKERLEAWRDAWKNVLIPINAYRQSPEIQKLKDLGEI